MSKTIKLSEESYAALEDLRDKRETYDQAVRRLIKVYHTISEVAKVLGPSHYLKSVNPPGRED